MRPITITTALLTAVALGAAAAHLEAAGEAASAEDAPATASFHLTTGPVSIALQTAVLGGQGDGWPAGLPAGAHVLLGVALPDLGVHAVHRVSYAAPALAGEGSGSPGRLIEALGHARLRAWLSWQAVS